MRRKFVISTECYFLKTTRTRLKTTEEADGVYYLADRTEAARRLLTDELQGILKRVVPQTPRRVRCNTVVVLNAYHPTLTISSVRARLHAGCFKLLL